MSMKYHDRPQFLKILELQKKAVDAHETFEKALAEADELVKDFREVYGDSFVSQGKLYAINSATHGFDCTKSRWWIYLRDAVKELL